MRLINERPRLKISLHSFGSILPSSRTLFTLLTAFSPYSSARCLAFFTDLPRNFLNWVLSENQTTQWLSLLYFGIKPTEDEKQATVFVEAHVFCFSFPPSVSARGGWDLSSSSDCAASLLKREKNISWKNRPTDSMWLGSKEETTFILKFTQ